MRRAVDSRWWSAALSIVMVVLLWVSPAEAEMIVTPPPDTTSAPSKFRSAEDGWLDVSGFLDEKYGFLPIVLPITEPRWAMARRWRWRSSASL